MRTRTRTASIATPAANRVASHWLLVRVLSFFFPDIYHSLLFRARPNRRSFGAPWPKKFILIGPIRCNFVQNPAINVKVLFNIINKSVEGTVNVKTWTQQTQRTTTDSSNNITTDSDNNISAKETISDGHGYVLLDQELQTFQRWPVAVKLKLQEINKDVQKSAWFWNQ